MVRPEEFGVFEEATPEKKKKKTTPAGFVGLSGGRSKALGDVIDFCGMVGRQEEPFILARAFRPLGGAAASCTGTRTK